MPDTQHESNPDKPNPEMQASTPPNNPYEPNPYEQTTSNNTYISNPYEQATPNNPYEQTAPPPPNAIPPYSKALFLGLIAAMVLAFLFAGVEALGVSLFGGALISMFVIDWKGLLTTDGLLKWRPMSNSKRVGMGCLLYCLFPIFLIIYLVRIGKKVFQAKGSVFTKEWDAPAPIKKRAKIGIIVGSISAIVLLIGSAAASTTTPNVSTSVTPTTAQTAVVSAPTPTSTSMPTPKPTPTLDPEHKSMVQEGQDCATRSYQSDYNPDHTQLVVIAASGIIDPQGNPQPWSTKDNAIKAGKAITFCLQKYLWAQEPNLQKIGVIVWGQVKDNTGKVTNVLAGGTLTQATAANFDWNQTPDQAWNNYDEQTIK